MGPFCPRYLRGGVVVLVDSVEAFPEVTDGGNGQAHFSGGAAGGVCKKCGTRLPAGAKFCSECGTPVETLCPKCGAKLLENAKFCPECGEKLK